MSRVGDHSPLDSASAPKGQGGLRPWRDRVARWKGDIATALLLPTVDIDLMLAATIDGNHPFYRDPVLRFHSDARSLHPKLPVLRRFGWGVALQRIPLHAGSTSSTWRPRLAATSARRTTRGLAFQQIQPTSTSTVSSPRRSTVSVRARLPGFRSRRAVAHQRSALQRSPPRLPLVRRVAEGRARRLRELLRVRRAGLDRAHPRPCPAPEPGWCPRSSRAWSSTCGPTTPRCAGWRSRVPAPSRPCGASSKMGFNPAHVVWQPGRRTGRTEPAGLAGVAPDRPMLRHRNPSGSTFCYLEGAGARLPRAGP